MGGIFQKVLRVGVPILYLHHSVLEAGHCLMDGWMMAMMLMTMMMIPLIIAVKLEVKQITHTQTHKHTGREGER